MEKRARLRVRWLILQICSLEIRLYCLVPFSGCMMIREYSSLLRWNVAAEYRDEALPTQAGGRQ
jgi:hypothetical protein